MTFSNTTGLDIAECSGFSKFISITGGGGKTSLMLFLSLFYKKCGERVLLTTTTKLSTSIDYHCDCILTEIDKRISVPSVLFVRSFSESRYSAPDIDEIYDFGTAFDRVIIEADGCCQRPLKYHSERDPVIPPFSDFVFCLMGADGLLLSCADSIFDSEIYFKDFPHRCGQRTTIEDYNNILRAKAGVYKGCKAKKTCLILNKIDLFPDLEPFESFVTVSGCVPVSLNSLLENLS